MHKTVGIICEYDPFHVGHARHYDLIREKQPNAAIVCIMSGPFTQRGMPALFAPAMRARAALNAGADMVMELPTLFATREAEHFCLSGVSILHKLNFISYISFGCENNNLQLLSEAATLLEQPGEDFLTHRTKGLRQGLSFAAAQGSALAHSLSRSTYSHGMAEMAGILAAPNNILAIGYLRAIQRLGSPIKPLPVQRIGAYHAKEIEYYPSATAIRAALMAGERDKAEAACGYTFPTEPYCRPDALDAVLLSRLRQMSKEELSLLPDCSEGLENSLFRFCRKAVGREQLLEMLKSKRYTHARLSRLLTHALLGITAGMQASAPFPNYARLLGFRKGSEPLLRFLQKSHLPVIAKAINGPTDDPVYQLDARAYDLWALGANQPAGLMFNQPIEIVPDETGQ